MYSFGKHRSKFGNFLDRHGITQSEIAKKAEVSMNTITRICSDGEYKPTRRIALRLVKALEDYDVTTRDFWG